jgi:hypothetical protein
MTPLPTASLQCQLLGGGRLQPGNSRRAWRDGGRRARGDLQLTSERLPLQTIPERRYTHLTAAVSLMVTLSVFHGVRMMVQARARRWGAPERMRVIASHLG